jgi:hypothetical protein
MRWPRTCRRTSWRCSKNVGTRVIVEGQERITIPGEDFFRAMLHIWIGNKPVDGRLRDAMLGK